MGGINSCSSIEEVISSNTTGRSIVSTRNGAENDIVYSPQPQRSKTQITPHDNLTYHDTYDNDLQLAIALSLNSQPKDISNISMLCGIDGILLFEESSLLIDGFIREIKNSFITQHIIPLELHKLCFEYFYVPTSISKLSESRNTAEILMDSYKVFEIEKLIFNKLCSTKYNINNLKMCQLILNNWKLNERLETFREYISECAKRCILKDNSTILTIILNDVIYDKKYEQWDMIRMNQIMYLINEAARYNSDNCLITLLKHPDKLDWTNELVNPTVLFNAVKYQYKDLNLMNFIIDKLQLVKIRFVCGDIMEEIIKYDLVEIAKRIVCNRWHTLNKNDIAYAKFMNLKCYKWIMEKINGYKYYSDGADHGLDLDEWKD